MFPNRCYPNSPVEVDTFYHVKEAAFDSWFTEC